jgi:hypothetical protein
MRSWTSGRSWRETTLVENVAKLHQLDAQRAAPVEDAPVEDAPVEPSSILFTSSMHSCTTSG